MGDPELQVPKWPGAEKWTRAENGGPPPPSRSPTEVNRVRYLIGAPDPGRGRPALVDSRLSKRSTVPFGSGVLLKIHKIERARKAIRF